MNIQTLDIDIANNVFQLHGVNRSGHVVLKRRVMRDRFSQSSHRSILAQWSSKPVRAPSTGRASARHWVIR